jgi:hypothetical protein
LNVRDISVCSNIAGNLNNGDTINVYSNLELDCNVSIGNVKSLTVCEDIIVKGNIARNLYNNGQDIQVYSNIDMNNNYFFNVQLDLDGNSITELNNIIINGNLELNCVGDISNVSNLSVCNNLTVDNDAIILGNMVGNLNNGDNSINIYSNLNFNNGFIAGLSDPIQGNGAVNLDYLNATLGNALGNGIESTGITFSTQLLAY